MALPFSRRNILQAVQEQGPDGSSCPALRENRDVIRVFLWIQVDQVVSEDVFGVYFFCWVEHLRRIRESVGSFFVRTLISS